MTGGGGIAGARLSMGAVHRTAYRADLDGLRALAVLAVILFHLGFEPFAGGYVGVDVFFVISGFLITGWILAELEAGTFSFSRFYMRRVRRLFPALLVTLAASFVVGAWLFSPADLASFAQSLVASLASASNFVFWKGSGYFDAGAQVAPLLHTWSLSVEEQFYLAWPVTLAALWRLGRSRAVLPFLAAAALLSLYAAQRWLHADAAGAFYLAPFRVVEFAIGALCVWLVAAAPAGRTSEPIALAGLAAIGYALFTFDRSTEFPGLHALVPCLGTAALIYAAEGTWVGAVLRNRVAVGVGLISYSLYLVHWPIYVFYRYWKVAPPSRAENLGVIAVSLALATAVFFLVEKPFRATADRVGALRPAAFLGTCAALALLLAAPAISAWRTRGWGWRVPADVARVIGDRAEFLRDHLRMVRAPGCFMVGSFETFASSLPDCLPLKDDRLNVLVLGDSYAADLWAALERAYPGVNLLQVTGPGCSPIEASYRDPVNPCRRMIGYVKHEFAGLRSLDGIVLSARWTDDYRALMDDVGYFRSLGVPVVVFGPVAEFQPEVRTLAYRLRRREGLEEFVERHRDADRVRLDREMRSFFAERGIPYISKIDVYCGDDACPVVDPDGRLMIEDNGHWGRAAADRFGRRLAERFARPALLFEGAAAGRAGLGGVGGPHAGSTPQ